MDELLEELLEAFLKKSKVLSRKIREINGLGTNRIQLLEKVLEES